jgi:hypothetical protein
MSSSVMIFLPVDGSRDGTVENIIECFFVSFGARIFIIDNGGVVFALATIVPRQVRTLAQEHRESGITVRTQLLCTPDMTTAAESADAAQRAGVMQAVQTVRISYGI